MSEPMKSEQVTLTPDESESVLLAIESAPFIRTRVNAAGPAGRIAKHIEGSIERIIAARVEAAKAEARRDAVLTEADLIGNGMCCDECDAVANMMRERVRMSFEPAFTCRLCGFEDDEPGCLHDCRNRTGSEQP